MAIIDSLNILSYRQVIGDVTYSDRAIDLQTSADYGVGRPVYVELVANGQHAKDLRAQVVGANKSDFSDCAAIADSGVIKAAKLVAGFSIDIEVPPTDKKYRYVAMRYIPSDADTVNNPDTVVAGASGTDVDISAYALPPKVGEEQEDLANGITAYFVLTPVSHVDYAHANDDKNTAGA